MEAKESHNCWNRIDLYFFLSQKVRSPPENAANLGVKRAGKWKQLRQQHSHNERDSLPRSSWCLVLSLAPLNSRYVSGMMWKLVQSECMIHAVTTTCTRCCTYKQRRDVGKVLTAWRNWSASSSDDCTHAQCCCCCCNSFKRYSRSVQKFALFMAAHCAYDSCLMLDYMCAL